jgi:DNA invertase Pin-like site-specific DNA recombinase
LHLIEAPYTQATQLIELGCQCIYVETGSGDHLHRSVLHRAIQSLQEGDVLVVGDGDRLSRNALHTDILVRRIHAQGATLQLLGPNRDLTPIGETDT